MCKSLIIVNLALVTYISRRLKRYYKEYCSLKPLSSQVNEVSMKKLYKKEESKVASYMNPSI